VPVCCPFRYRIDLQVQSVFTKFSKLQVVLRENGQRIQVCFTGVLFVGLARTIYLRCIYGIFSREITKYTVIYGVYIRFGKP